MIEIETVEIIQGKTNLLLMTGTFCAPCRIIKPVFNDFIENHNEESNVHAKMYDVMEIDSNFIRRFRVMNVPTLLIFNKDGEIIDRVSDTEKLNDIDFYKSIK